MNNLVKNEITKIIKKKSFYIMLIVVLAYIVLSNVMYKYVYNSTTNYEYYSDSYAEILRQEMKNLNLENQQEVDIYIGDKTELDIYELLKQYDKESWQYKLIPEKAGSYLSEINTYTYKIKDEEALNEAKDRYNKFTERLKEDDWKSFAREEIETLKLSQEGINETEKDKDKGTELQIEVLEMRLKYDIPYGNDYKNDALNNYSQNKMCLLELEKNNNKTYEEQRQYQMAKEEAEKNKYVIEQGKDIYNSSDSRGFLLNVFSKYELFIIITVVLIAGAIVSDEFNKGTIKLLLVRPFSRAKILLAKFITVIITVLFIMIVTVILQFIIGGIFFGYSSLSIPAVVYNHTTGQLVEMGILKNIILTGLGKMPIYILLGTLAFALSTIFNNTPVAITITLMGYIASSIINQFAYYYDIKWLKFFVTPNWDFTQFFYGGLPLLEGMKVPFSVVICLIYFAIMMVVSFMVFKKRNIKNV